MNEDASLQQKIRDCISRTLHLPVTPGPMQMGSTPGWDSMGHMMVVLEIEKEFKVRFPAHLLPELTTIDLIAGAIERQRV